MTTTSRRPVIAALPLERAFVLQIAAEADLVAGRLGGRVEHVVSGRAARFRSLRQLLAFLESAAGAPTARRERPLVPGGGAAAPARKQRDRALPAPVNPTGKRRRR